MSSDGNASLPTFNVKGELSGLEVGRVSSLYNSFVELIKHHNVPMEHALATISSSPADILKLKNKGRIEQGRDADLVLLRQDTLKIDKVFSMGQLMVDQGKALIKGTFESR